ncbi:MAG: RluA family pseudouridine synthase [Planctomycetota bacterium]
MNSSDSEHEVTAADAGQRLDRWLAAPTRLGSRSRAAAAIERGKIFVAGVEQGLDDAGRRLTAGERVRIWMDRPGSRPRRVFKSRVLAGLHLVFEDDDLVVVDKPAGLLTVPRTKVDRADTVVARLERALDPERKQRLFVVHRIDLGTTGLVVVARNARAHQHLKEQFRRREPERRYLAVVHGVPFPEAGTWEDILLADKSVRIQRRARDGEPSAKAMSHYAVVERFEASSLLQVDLVTGKRNQIRVQASLRGHPLAGDALYTSDRTPSTLQFERPALHATHLAFNHPRDHGRLEFDSPLPSDMEGLLRKLRGGAVAGPSPGGARRRREQQQAAELAQAELDAARADSSAPEGRTAETRNLRATAPRRRSSPKRKKSKR